MKTKPNGARSVRIVVPGLLAGWIVLMLGSSLPLNAANPEGGKIAFEGDLFGDWGLSAMQPDGSGIRDLHALLGAADAAWSPNGMQVAFEADPNGDANLEIFVMDADGTNLVQLTDSPEWDFWPAWFPNGNQIAYTSLDAGVPNIWVMNADGSDQHPLTEETDFASVQPDVSPNGQQVVFHREPRSGPSKIWVINADGSDAHQLSAPGVHVDTDPQWSPNGQTIVFSSNRSGTFEIFTMDADGSNPVQLTTSAGSDFNPTFSPDGRQIAWWKLRFGQGDVWTMNLDGTDQINITDSPVVFEGFPDWHQGHLADVKPGEEQSGR